MLWPCFFVIGLAKFIAAEDEPVSVLLDRGNAALARGNVNEALTIFTSAIDKDNRNYMTYFKRATTYLAVSKHSAALNDFNSVLSIKPDFTAALVQRAKVMSSLGRWESAVADFKAAKEDNASIVDVEAARKAASSAETAHAQGAADQCIEDVTKAISVASASSSLRILRARCMLLRGDSAEAIGDLVYAGRLNPSDAEGQILSATILFFVNDDSERGLQQLKTCLHYDPDAKACKKSFRTLRKINKARAVVSKAKDAKTWILAKKALLGSGDDEGLLKLVEQERDLLIQSGVLNAKLSLGLLATLEEISCQILGEAKDGSAAKHCDQALTSNPSSIEALLMKATLEIRAEEYQAAIDILQKANEVTGGQDQRVNEQIQLAQRLLRTSQQKNYYKVLDVERDADLKTIKKAYRKLTKEFHPDKYRGDLSKEQVVKKIESINEAYEVLSSPELRQRFDNGDDPNAPQDQQHNPFAHHGFHQGGHQQFFQGNPFGEAFGGGFGGGGGHTFKFSF